MALLAWDSNKRSAIRARKRVIGTRSSVRSPRDVLEIGKGAAVDPVFVPPETALSTSPLVTRPSRPEPET